MKLYLLDLKQNKRVTKQTIKITKELIYFIFLPLSNYTSPMYVSVSTSIIIDLYLHHFSFFLKTQ
jgi:hypothetical protein